MREAGVLNLKTRISMVLLQGRRATAASSRDVTANYQLSTFHCLHATGLFKECYPSTHVIIDCTEVFTEVPSSMSVQSLTYFSYKHNNTFKGLVGILPQELLHLFLIYMLALYLIRHLPVIVAYWNLLSLVTQLWPTKALTLVTMCYFVVQSLIFPHF